MKQESLFADNANMPLANRVRPRSLNDFVGQEQLLGSGKIAVLVKAKDVKYVYGTKI